MDNQLVPPNAFEELDLSPGVDNRDIMQAVMKKMIESPDRLQELAKWQELLFDPKNRFLIELFYFPDFLS